MQTVPTRLYDVFLSSKFSKSGFTLIEVLLTMMILALLSAFTFAGFSSISKDHLLKDAVSELKTNLRYVQNQSSSGVKPSGCNTESLASYRAVFVSTQTTYDATANCGEVSIPIISAKLPSNVFFRAIYLNSASVSSLDARFLPNGQMEFYDSGNLLTGVDSVYLEIVYGSPNSTGTVYRLYLTPNGGIYETKSN